MSRAMRITLTAEGERQVVDESKAREMVEAWRKKLRGADLEHRFAESDTGAVIVCDAIVLSNKSYTEQASLVIAEFLSTPDLLPGMPAPSSTMTRADLSDVIASRPETEGLNVLKNLCDALRNSNLVEVDLSDNAMGTKGLTACASVIAPQNTSSLTRLSLCNNGLSGTTMQEVAEALCNGDDPVCSRLEKIHFFNNMSGDDGCAAFARILSGCTDSLQDVRFSGTRAGREGSILVSSAMENLSSSKLVNLHKLDLADNSFGKSGGSMLARSLRRCSYLTHINLRDCLLLDDATSEICRALWACDAPLEFLDLSGNEITYKAAKSIAELIEERKGTLQVLHCEENDLGSRGVSYIASALGNSLTELRLGWNDCGRRGATALITADLPNLLCLNVDGNRFPSDCVEELMETYGEKMQEMEENEDEDISEDEDEDEEDDDDEGEEDDKDIDALTSAMSDATLRSVV